MQTEAIKQLIEENLVGSQAQVEGDGSHFQAVVVSDSFATQRTVQRQQSILNILQPYISDGSLHAISLKTYTPQEWASKEHT